VIVSIWLLLVLGYNKYLLIVSLLLLLLFGYCYH
jgi:hypothetical protein